MAFTRETWVEGGPPDISAANLNRIEQGIVDIDANQAPVPIKFVRVATTASITLSGTQTIDGISLSAGNRVLVKDQGTASQNGVYDVAAGTWLRSSDAQTSTTLPPSTLVVIEQGSANGDSIWMLTTNTPITVGTTSLSFAKPPFPATDASASAKGSVFTSAAPAVAASPTAVSINDPALESYQTGCQMVWNSATSVSISTGGMYIPGSNKIVNVSSTLTPTMPSLTASTFYYLYLFESAGTAAGEIVTTTPAAPYKGKARTKTGDTSRRLAGVLRSNAAGTAIFKFGHGADGWVRYLEWTSLSPFRVLTNSASAGGTTISFANVVPAIAQFARANFYADSATLHYVGWGDAVGSPTSANFNLVVEGNKQTSSDVELSSSQTLNYISSSATVGLTVDCTAYLLER